MTLFLICDLLVFFIGLTLQPERIAKLIGNRNILFSSECQWEEWMRKASHYIDGGLLESDEAEEGDEMEL
jgi:hypothetical protein